MIWLRRLLLAATLTIALGISWSTHRNCRAQHGEFARLARAASGGGTVESLDQDLQPIRNILAGQKRIGYISSRTADSERKTQRRVLLQYSLAPTVLEPDAALPWALSYPDTVEEVAEFRKERPYELAHTTSLGFLLFKGLEVRE